MSEGESEGPVAAPKAVWNSLEVSKLIMSAATPMMIFAMGSLLSYQSTQQSIERDAADKAVQAKRDAADRAAQDARAAADKLAAAKRDEDIAIGAALREKQGREETARFQLALKVSEDRRDDRIRASSISREQYTKEADLRNAKLTALYQKRISLWDTIGPKLTSLRVDLRWMLYPGPGRPSALQGLRHGDMSRDLKDIETVFLANDFYFSKLFGMHFMGFLEKQDQVIAMATDNSLPMARKEELLGKVLKDSIPDADWIDRCIGDELGTREVHTEGC